MRSTGFSLAAILLAVAFIFGCSGGTAQPVIPSESQPPANTADSISSHSLWGLWQFTADPTAGTLDVVPLRTTDLHLNALPFLEPPPFVYLTLETLHINGNIIETDIGLRHPFLGLNQFTGFDVCGIFISNGSLSGFDDPALVMAGDADTRMLNPDGYSRWWNPTEFPDNGTIFGYTDGELGTPDSIGDYNSTLNGYKYYCDDLDDPDDPLSDVSLVGRGVFSAGHKNVRHYTIELAGATKIFNYAVDAAWKFPSGAPPYDVPGDFGPLANRQEAWRADVTETLNTLWDDGIFSGGALSLSIDVYDWFNASLNQVSVQSPGNFDPVNAGAPIGGGPGYSTYEVDIPSATPGAGWIDILITASCEDSGYGGAIPGAPVAAYFIHTAPVAAEPPAGWELVLENAQQVLDPITGDWPQLDDYSPTIAETQDESMLVLWFAVNDTNDIVGYYEGGSNWGSGLYGFKSTDSGLTWNEGQKEHTGIGAELIMRDGLKSLPYISGARMHCAWPGYPSSTSSTNYVSQLEYTDQHHVFWKTKADRFVDAVIRDDAKLVVFSDYGGEINAQVSTGTDWDDPSPFWYPPGEQKPDHLVADPGYVSQVRSAARDLFGVLYLVYYTGDTGSNNDIVLSSSTDGGVSWDPQTMFDGDPALYEEVRDPSIYIFDDDIYITYTRKNIALNQYQLMLLIYDGTPVGQGTVIATSDNPISDAEAISGMIQSTQLTAVTYAADGGVYCAWRMDADAFSSPALISAAGVEGSLSDFIIDFVPSEPHAYLQFVWCERDDELDNWQVYHRRGYMQQ